MFDSSPLVTPGRQDFVQGAIYRLRLSGIPGREAIELFPTLEVAPVTPRTDAFLAHAPIPVQFTVEDFDQVTSGNFVTKVIYLPDPEFQELTLTGVETLVSTRLDPGVDPIAEADRRGSILAIVRMGNKDFRGSGWLDELRSLWSERVPGGVMCANYQADGSMAPTPVDGYQGEFVPKTADRCRPTKSRSIRQVAATKRRLRNQLRWWLSRWQLWQWRLRQRPVLWWRWLRRLRLRRWSDAAGHADRWLRVRRMYRRT